MDGLLLMGQEHTSCALIELMETGKTSSSRDGQIAVILSEVTCRVEADARRVQVRW